MGMTLDAIKADPRYIKLPANQKSFIDNFCTNGADKFKAATDAGYKGEHAAYSLMSTLPVKQLTDAFMDIDPAGQHFTKDELMSFYCELARDSKAKHTDRLKAAQAYEHLKWPEGRPNEDDELLSKMVARMEAV